MSRRQNCCCLRYACALTDSADDLSRFITDFGSSGFSIGQFGCQSTTDGWAICKHPDNPNGVKQTPIWQAGHNYKADDRIKKEVEPGTNSYYIARNDGMSGAIQPMWPSGGGIVVDNEITWWNSGIGHVERKFFKHMVTVQCLVQPGGCTTRVYFNCDGTSPGDYYMEIVWTGDNYRTVGKTTVYAGGDTFESVDDFIIGNYLNAQNWVILRVCISGKAIYCSAVPIIVDDAHHSHLGDRVELLPTCLAECKHFHCGFGATCALPVSFTNFSVTMTGNGMKTCKCPMCGTYCNHCIDGQVPIGMRVDASGFSEPPDHGITVSDDGPTPPEDNAPPWHCTCFDRQTYLAYQGVQANGTGRTKCSWYIKGCFAGPDTEYKVELKDEGEGASINYYVEAELNIQAYWIYNGAGYWSKGVYRRDFGNAKPDVMKWSSLKLTRQSSKGCGYPQFVYLTPSDSVTIHGTYPNQTIDENGDPNLGVCSSCNRPETLIATYTWLNAVNTEPGCESPYPEKPEQMGTSNTITDVMVPTGACNIFTGPLGFSVQLYYNELKIIGVPPTRPYNWAENDPGTSWGRTWDRIVPYTCSGVTIDMRVRNGDWCPMTIGTLHIARGGTP